MNWMFDKNLQSKIPGTPAWQEKREEEGKKREIYLVNQQLQRLLKSVPKEVLEDEQFKKCVQKANRNVVQSHILNLGYINNYESEDVAISSIELLLHAVLISDDESFNKKIKYELKYPIAQIQRLTFGKRSEIELLEREVNKKSRNA
jgi:hypothetical protein